MAAKPKVDLSEFYRLSRPKKSPCRVGFMLSQLSEQDVVNFTGALAEDKGLITAGAILDAAKKRGHDLSVAAVTSHRKGSCTCFEEAS